MSSAVHKYAAPPGKALSAHKYAAPPGKALTARMGMWLFLFTELILFGGLFLLYAVYRTQFSEDFHYAAGGLDTGTGTANTLILLTSSLTMVLSIAFLKQGRRQASLGLVLATMALGAAFMVNKVFEWTAKFEHGLYPSSDILVEHTPGENMFYGMYYTVTGLHGIHVLAGIAVLGWMAWTMLPVPGPRMESSEDGKARTESGEDGDARMRSEVVERKLENAGLYWHLVDVIWIFVFPLFYLIS